mgnify:CR=1 FL=1
MGDQEDDIESLSEMPVLEEHSIEESAETMGGVLISKDEVSLLASKVMVLETFLKLSMKNIHFTDFMREILILLMKVVKSEGGAILEVDEVNERVFFRSAAGYTSDKVSRFVIPMGQGVVGHVLESRQPFLVNSVEDCEIHLKSITKIVGFEAINMIAVPIIVRGKSFAVIELLNRVGEDLYSDQDLEFIQYFCEMVSHAIEMRLVVAWNAKNQPSGEEAA